MVLCLVLCRFYWFYTPVHKITRCRDCGHICGPRPTRWHDSKAACGPRLTASRDLSLESEFSISEPAQPTRHEHRVADCPRCGRCSATFFLVVRCVREASPKHQIQTRHIPIALTQVESCMCMHMCVLLPTPPGLACDPSGH